MNNNIYTDKIKKHRRLKFGALAVSITVAVVALVVVINAVFTALATKFLWYVDMTDEKIYGITQPTLDLLDDYRSSESFKIEIIFCSYEDELMASQDTNMVHNLARQYEEEFDFITVRYVDIVNHPEAVDKYLGTTVSKPKTHSVIVTNGTQSRLLSLESFFTTSKETGKAIAFDGEYRLTLTILQLAGDNPIAYFVTGHGEDIDGTVMWSLFEEAGYQVKKIDLSKETPDDAAKVMVINNPRYDFMGDGDGVNEIAKIDKFLDGFGGLMVFMDAGAPDMPELDAFLAEWGIAFEEKLIRDYENAISIDGTELVAEYNADTNKPGASLTNTLRALENPPKPIVNKAKPITLLYDTKMVGYGNRFTGTVLQTSSDRTAEAVPIANPEGEGEKGQYNLMTISVEQNSIDNATYSSYVLAAGTSSFADDKYVGSGAYANRDIIFSAMKAFGKKTVPLELDCKFFDSTELSLTKGDANRLTVLFTLALPIVTAGVGIYVYIRRRYQ